MNRKVETSIFKILDMVVLMRDEQGTLGSLAREVLADMLVTPPTADDVKAYLDHLDKEAGVMTLGEALALHKGDDIALDEIWRDVRYEEEPIAEFLSLWSADGTRQRPGSSGPVWHVTPRYA
jgi:hypothetical protein